MPQNNQKLKGDSACTCKVCYLNALTTLTSLCCKFVCTAVCQSFNSLLKFEPSFTRKIKGMIDKFTFKNDKSVPKHRGTGIITKADLGTYSILSMGKIDKRPRTNFKKQSFSTV